MTKQKPKYQHGFLGLGKMASVLLTSFLKAKQIPANQVIATRRSAKKLAQAQKKLRIHTSLDPLEVAASSQYLWLGIKPFQAAELLTKIAPVLPPSSLLLSMMAGVSCKSLKKLLKPQKNAVLRLMPNTPTLLGQGMTGLYFPPRLASNQQNQVLKLLQSTGQVLVVKKESQLDAVTALSGSGPAFVYYFAQALIQGGRQSGLSASEAQSLCYQTLKGSLAMLENSQQSPEALIQQVLSPKGTTEAGLQYLEKFKVAQHLNQSIQKAYQRAQTIKKELETCMS